MKGINISRMGKTIVRTISRNKSTILTVVGLVGLGVTVYVTAKQAPKAKEEIDKAKLKKYIERIKKDGVYKSAEGAEIVIQEGDDLENDDTIKSLSASEKLTMMELVKATWKQYIWVVAVAGSTAAAIVMAHYFDAKTITALTALYATNKEKADKWMKEAKEKMEPEKYEEVKTEIAQEELQKTKIDDADLGPDEHWFFDLNTGRPFKSTLLKVKEAFIDAEGELNHESGMVSWKSLCSYLGEDEVPEMFDDYLFTYDRNKGMSYELGEIPGSANYTIEYDNPKHYSELGMKHPY